MPDLKVVFTRGEGCAELAEALTSSARRSGEDLAETCRDHRADLLITRKATSFDLVSKAYPRDFSTSGLTGIVAAVGGGPNSRLGAAVAARLGDRLGLPVTLLSGFRNPEDAELARDALWEAAAIAPSLPRELVPMSSPSDLTASLPAGTLLVIGAPGGRWLQRQFFGTGARVLAKAPAGAVIVEAAPRRVFHVMSEPTWVGPQMRAADAIRIATGVLLPVVSEGRLIGVVDTRELARLPEDEPVAAALRSIDSARVDDPATHRIERPLPVVDDEGRLVGLLEAS